MTADDVSEVIVPQQNLKSMDYAADGERLAGAPPDRMGEFSAVVLAAGADSGLFPLTSDSSPKALLPLCQSPLLSYQLWSLEAAGFREATVVCSAQHRGRMETFLESFSSNVRVALHCVDEAAEDFGTARTLRELREKTSGDLLVMAGDVVTQASLQDLADVHRVHDAGVTMLLREHANAADKDSRKVLRKLSKEVINYFGLAPTRVREAHQRVVLMQTAAEDDPVFLPKGLLVRQPNVQVRSDLVDPHVYIVRRSVLDIVCAVEPGNEAAEMMAEMTSFRSELLPFIVNKLQFLEMCGSAEEVARIPGRAGFEDPLALARSMSAAAKGNPSHQLGCFALVVGPETYAARANTLFSFKRIAHELAANAFKSPTPWPKPPPAKGYRGTSLGHRTTIGKGTEVQNCVIGTSCTVGAAADLTNTIVMDHCVIGAGVVMHDCIVSSNTTVEERCKLEGVQVGPGSRVGPAGATIKSQAVVGDLTGADADAPLA